jgi:DNA-binding MarR family transcriptional regulator
MLKTMNKNNDFTIPDQEIDKLVHEPARLKIMMYLYVADSADFVYLMHKTGLSKGNLSSHLSKLEEAEYVIIEKKFVEKIPRTMMSLSKKGQAAFEKYKNTMQSFLSSVD